MMHYVLSDEAGNSIKRVTLEEIRKTARLNVTIIFFVFIGQIFTIMIYYYCAGIAVPVFIYSVIRCIRKVTFFFFLRMFRC